MKEHKEENVVEEELRNAEENDCRNCIEERRGEGRRKKDEQKKRRGGIHGGSFKREEMEVVEKENKQE